MHNTSNTCYGRKERFLSPINPDNKSLHPIWPPVKAFARCSRGEANALPGVQTGELNRYLECRLTNYGRFLVAAVLIPLLVGCSKSPSSMISSSLTVVEKRFGVPDTKSITSIPIAQPLSKLNAPMPTLLYPGESYLYVHYSNLNSRQWTLVFVSPELYNKRKGNIPGPEPWYLLETMNYDKDLRF